MLSRQDEANMNTKALQDIIHPEGVCFGCGPSSGHGLRIKSYWDDKQEFVVAEITPAEYFCGWPGLVYGGYLAMITDCHSGCACIAAHYRAEGREPGSLPVIRCATGKLSLKYIKPTPMGVPLHLKAWVEGAVARKSRVMCRIYAGGELTVEADSIFVRVNPEEFAR